MKLDKLTKALLAIVTVCLAMSLFHSVQSASAQTLSTKIVEYKVTMVGDANQQQLQTALDTAGKSGWEFVSHYGTRTGDVLIFKR